MTRAKTIITFFLFLAGFLFIGESYTFFLDNFQDRYVQVGYYLETGDAEVRMRETIINKAREYEAEVFAIRKEDGGAFSRTITVYGNETVRETLKTDWGIEEGTISSFFSGDTTFEFKPLDEATEKELQDVWYIGQTQEHLYSMLFPGMVQYSGNFRNSPSPVVSELAVGALWFVLILTILLLTYYDMVYSKKEQKIRIVFGADVKRMIVHKFIKDTVGLCIAALAAVLLLLPFTNPLFRWDVSFIGFLILVLSNGVLVALCMRVRKNLRIKSIASSVKALRMSLALKGTIAVLSVIVLSSTIYLSVEGIKLYQQKDYYSTQSNRVHIDLSYPFAYEKMEFATGNFEHIPLDTRGQIHDNFMRYGYQHLDLSLVNYQSYAEISPKWGDKYIFANLSGLTPYKDHIPAWDVITHNEGNYILIPDDANQSEVVEEILESGSLIGLDDGNLTGVFTYQAGLSVIAEGHINNEYDYSYKVKNPVILLDTYDYGALPLYSVSYELRDADHPDGILAHNIDYLMQFVTLTNKREQINQFSHAISGDAIKPSLMEFEVMNVGDWFDGLWSLQNRSLLIAVILTVLILILEMQISVIALRMAYESKARELTIKKVMGYSLIERFKSFFLITAIVCGLSFVVALVCAWKWKVGVIGYITWGSILVFLLDVSILLYLTRKNDRLQIQKVLKGGL